MSEIQAEDSIYCFPNSRASAAHQLLHIPLILENIILHLSIRDILVNAQRVNQTWRSIISSYTSIQRALFLKPWATSDITPPESMLNPLLEELFPIWFRDRGCRWPAETGLDWSSDVEKMRIFMRKEASWRQMLPVQPPAEFLSIVRSTDWRGGSSKIVGQIPCIDGLRMGTLYDLTNDVGWGVNCVMKWRMFVGSEDSDDEDGDNEGGSDEDGKAKAREPFKREAVAKLRTYHVMQCALGVRRSWNRRGLQEAWRSEGHHDIDVDYVNH
jgi:hypothetical protein